MSSACSTTPLQVDPEEVGRIRRCPVRHQSEHRADAVLGYVPIQWDRLHDVESVDHTMDQRSVHPAARRLPLVEHRGAEVGQ